MGSCAPSPPSQDIELESASIQDLTALLVSAGVRQAEHHRDAVLAELGALYDQILQQRADTYAPRLDDKTASGQACLSLIERGASIRSLVYTAEVDSFQGRTDILKELDCFAMEPDSAETGGRMRWWLLTAPGGSGKSRLALQFLRSVQALGWWAGFLDKEELDRLDGRRWQPSEPTLMIIDYPAERAEKLPDLLVALAQHANRFEYPVRLLLLERQAAGEWFDALMKPGSDQDLLEATRWRPPRELPPLDRESLLTIMQRRLGDAALEPEQLWDLLVTVDNRQVDEQPAPRALFAAATALLLAQEGCVEHVSREAVLEDLLQRERARFWHRDNDDGDKRRAHEHLLVLSTATLGIETQAFRDASEALPAKAILPGMTFGTALPRFEADRFRRMSGHDPSTRLQPLEPDLLGEYFVLSTLVQPSPDIQPQTLIDSAYQLPGSRMDEFAARCFLDFPELYDRCDSLKPSPAAGADASALYARTLLRVSYGGGRGVDPSQVDRLLTRLQAPGPSDGDERTNGHIALALVNTGITLKDQNRSEEAIAVYDALLDRFGDDPTPAVRKPVAMAMVHKGVTLGALDRSEEAIAVYDALLDRFGDDPAPAVREPVAITMVNKGAALRALDRSEEAIAVYDALLDRFGDDPAPAVHEPVAMAMVNKGVTLRGLDRSEEAIAVYDALLDRFGDDPTPAVRERVAKAMVNKGVALGALDRSEDEIAVYDALLDRFGDDPTPAVREPVAMAMVNKGAALGALDRSEEAIAVYDALLDRFGDDPTPAVREPVGQAKVNRQALLAMHALLRPGPPGGTDGRAWAERQAERAWAQDWSDRPLVPLSWSELAAGPEATALLARLHDAMARHADVQLLDRAQVTALRTAPAPFYPGCCLLDVQMGLPGGDQAGPWLVTAVSFGRWSILSAGARGGDPPAARPRPA